MFPKSSIPKSPFEKAKYLFTKRLSLFTAIVLGFLSIFYLIQQDIFFYPVIAGSIFALITYMIVSRTRYIRLAALFAILSIEVIIITKLFVTSQFHYFEDFFWIMCLVVFAFFVLGKVSGMTTLIFNVCAVYTAFYLERNDIINLYQRPENPIDEINFAVNLVIGVTIFSAIVIELLRQNDAAKREYQTTHKQLEITSEEKTVMLKEIHHRVKNNLQIITSLLRLQANEIKHTDQKAVFTESINRIAAIAKIHDQMYQSEQLNRIDMGKYIENLIQELIQNYAVNKDVTYSLTSNVEKINPNNLIPIAIIINELVTNSIKHGFKGKMKGQIDIQAERVEENGVLLTYHDDGEWKEPDVNASSIGLELIDSFVEQLDGEMSNQVSNGTTFRFKLYV